MEVIENFANHLNRVITVCREFEKEIFEIKEKYRAAHQELIEIHHIGMCIAECPPILATDTTTVKMVKEMAIRINQMMSKATPSDGKTYDRGGLIAGGSPGATGSAAHVAEE